MTDYWLYVPEEALKNAQKLGWYPDAGAEVQWYVLGEGGTLIVENEEDPDA